GCGRLRGERRPCPERVRPRSRRWLRPRGRGRGPARPGAVHPSPRGEAGRHRDRAQYPRQGAGGRDRDATGGRVTGVPESSGRGAARAGAVHASPRGESGWHRDRAQYPRQGDGDRDRDATGGRVTGVPESSGRGCRVFLVDDHAVFRSGVRAELGGQAGIDVVGEAGSVAEAVAGIERVQPEVVLLDVHMPDGGGVAVLRSVLGERAVESAQAPGPTFLALSVSDAAEDVIAVIRSGARGYVTKTISGEDLADAVRRVADGDA